MNGQIMYYKLFKQNNIKNKVLISTTWMNDPLKLYKWKVSDTNDYILFHLYKIFRVGSYMETESRLMYAQG